ncbi:hypothetical protein CHLRE_06g307400v5 [Chlamydomonas reinhardtii]|uniref:Endonuclease/exonuclease/phosphatase domain-containing protein n=1 Tax=Chlamydomonas reinhardtii TaxID=3055 RepID=A0A2K3DRG6_CHLRE|nr:uncharacterized protein CHLRE_06g307400v5 [Chlamydomonas reinhardtii]PNW83120.1 hypothetical protein CHLRE_06g307400v5 [Chlamydomonas reinhardtii]
MVSKVLLSTGIAVLGWLTISKLRRASRSGQRRARKVRRPEALQSSEPDEISVVCYNLLADVYATPKRYPYVRPEWLAWPHRWAALQQQLASFGADVICLQEVEPARWQEIVSSPALAGYTGLLQDRGRGSDAAPVITNALLWRPDKLGLVWSESRSRALLAAFVFWDGVGQQQLLYVANLHLEGSPYRPNDRISQTRSALQRLEAHQLSHGLSPGDAAVVVCGDFNSGRHETVCSFLHRGRLEGGTTEPHLPQVEVTKTTIAHPYALHEAYSSGGVELPFTRKHVCRTPLLLRLMEAVWHRPWAGGGAAAAAAAAGGRWWLRRRGRRICAWRGPRVPSLASSLDFIWASCNLEVTALYVPVEARHQGLIAHQALPNQHYPSDHLPIGAVLKLKHFYVEAFGDAHPPQPPAPGDPPQAIQDFEGL